MSLPLHAEEYLSLFVGDEKGVKVKYRRKVPGEGYAMMPEYVYVKKDDLLGFASAVADVDIKIYEVEWCRRAPKNARTYKPGDELNLTL